MIMSDETLGDMDGVKKINEKINIVKDSKALIFPAKLKHLIWKNKNTGFSKVTLADYAELVGISSAIINDLPDWTDYNDHSVVLKETTNVLRLSLENRMA